MGPSPAKAFTEATKACQELCCLDSLPSHPDTEYLVLSSDANDSGFGGLLASKSKTENRIRLHQLLSCRLPEAVQNLHIYLEEMYSLVALVNQVEDILKLYKGIPIKAVVDNSALFVTLNKLARNGHISVHHKILEKEKINLYLSRLYQAITSYNIEIYLSGTKTHLSDYVSRSSVDWESEILITSDPWETNLEPKEDSSCPRCQLTQTKELPHPEYCDKKIKDIPNSTRPNILQVIPSQPKTTICEGKTVTYRVGRVKLGQPLRVDFPTIYSSICPFPSAQEEILLSKQPMYPSDSTQLVFLMNNLDKDFINRAKTSLKSFEIPFQSDSSNKQFSTLHTH